MYLIGDASQWGGLDYFRERLDALPTRNVDVSGEQRSMQDAAFALVDNEESIAEI